ncbi:MAG: hypothetical protein IJI14_05425 [Anaerolineaceae bacterium]|nr:hypothetical protein [Anaerolineaceae bacterium]
MKRITTLIIVFIAALSCAIGASAAQEKAYFTCDSDPKDFNGKTFERLYVLLNGCENFDSPIIPGKEAFVTLRDITVTESLRYLDDTYDRSTGTYHDAVIGEQLTTADHYLNIVGNSSIYKLHAECIDPHVCNLGLQSPVEVALITTTGGTGSEKPRLVIRGYIDPLVDSSTDYYNDTIVKNFPDFDVNTFDFDFAATALKDVNRFDFLSMAYANASTITHYPYSLSWLEEYQELTPDERALFTRAFVENIDLYNGYKVSGNFNVDLVNIESGNVGIDNSSAKGDWRYSQYKWDPVIRSKGFTTIASLTSTANFKTAVVEDSAHTAKTADTERTVLPMFIDLLMIGTPTEKKITYDMNNTRVVMLNYLGNEDPDSEFTLKTNANGNSYNNTSIGMANIIGGAFKMSSATTTAGTPTIDVLNFYEGNDNFSYYSPNGDGSRTVLYNLYHEDIENTYLFSWDPLNRTEEKAHKADRERRLKLYEEKIIPTSNFARTGVGYFEVTRTLDDYLKIGNADMSGKSNVSFYGQNVSLGDINVSKNLGDITTWMDGSCHFWQHGKQQMVVGKITK